MIVGFGLMFLCFSIKILIFSLVRSFSSSSSDNSKSKFRFFQNPILTNILVESAFPLLYNKHNLQRVILGNEHIFNRLTDHNLNLPDLFKKFKYTSPDSPFLTKKDIYESIEVLKKAGKPINLDNVSETLGVKKSYFNTSRNRPLMDIILCEGKTEVSKLENQVKKIINDLQRDSKNVSMSRVAREMKVDISVLSEHPELSHFFRKKKEMNPAYINRILKAIEDVRQGEKRITKTEIARRAKISCVTINKYPVLKKIVEKAIEAQKTSRKSIKN